METTELKRKATQPWRNIIQLVEGETITIKVLGIEEGLVSKRTGDTYGLINFFDHANGVIGAMFFDGGLKAKLNPIKDKIEGRWFEITKLGKTTFMSDEGKELPVNDYKIFELEPA